MSARSAVLLSQDQLSRAAALPGGQAGAHASSHLAQYSAGVAGVQLAKYPEVALFSQLGQLFPQTGTGTANNPNGSGKKNRERNGQNTKSDAKSSYASRHQAAEQRRRMRINDRLDSLRTIVPHKERANTADFLEDVIIYIGKLNDRVKELEEKLGDKPSTAVATEKASEEQAESKKRKAKGEPEQDGEAVGKDDPAA